MTPGVLTIDEAAFETVVGLDDGSVSRPVAEAIASFELREPQQRRLHELGLAAKRRELTASESAEFDSLNTLVKTVSLWRLKARKALGLPLSG